MAEIRGLLARAATAVELLERSSAAPDAWLAGAALIGGGSDPEEVAGLSAAIGADVVHAHNIIPLFGARALAAARRAGARVVMHLHNYRLACAVATTSATAPCARAARGRNTLPGVRHRCRGSRARPAAYGARPRARTAAHVRAVDRFAAPSASPRGASRAGSRATSRSRVLHNFVGDDEFAAAPPAARGQPRPVRRPAGRGEGSRHGDPRGRLSPACHWRRRGPGPTAAPRAPGRRARTRR